MTHAALRAAAVLADTVPNATADNGHLTAGQSGASALQKFKPFLILDS